MHKLIIAEKPSVAKNIADALGIKGKKDGYYEGNEYLITWAFGHLLELYDAKDYDPKLTSWKLEFFPFIPNQFQYKIKTGAAKQLKIIGSLIKRAKLIISACDYDREGQIIGDTIISYFPHQLPVYRLLLNEWTKEEVLKGLKSLKPNTELKSLYDAGITRQWADWVIGINLTSVATLKRQMGSNVLNIGRVLLPTLKMIYDRDQEIKHFKPETYFKLKANFATKDGETFEATYFEGKNDQFTNEQYLNKIKQKIKNSQAKVIEKSVEKKKEYPPYLFNLTNLQGFITSKFQGFTADKVLKVAQSLYEKKLITYPRTASIVLEESLVPRAKKVLANVSAGLPFADEIKFIESKRIFDNSKVDSHSAIIPTYVKPKKLTKDEAIVYEAIKNRFIAQFMPAAIDEETKLVMQVEHHDVKGLFIAKGKVQLVEGWKKVENVTAKEKALPKVELHELVMTKELKVAKEVTKPPNHHTEKSLLRLMETCGKKINPEEMTEDILSGYSIGTPATRAETISKLKRIGYIKQEKKYLTCTELGKQLVETFPVKELFDYHFTGRLEKALSDIEKRKLKKEIFLNFIYQFTSSAVHKIKNDDSKFPANADSTHKVLVQREILGKCPVCGQPVIEGKTGFGCINYKKSCTFIIWKNDRFFAAMKKKPTKTFVKTLLKNNVAEVKGLTSKKGNKFNAKLRYVMDPQTKSFQWKMEFS